MGHATRAVVGEERVRGSGGTHGPPRFSSGPSWGTLLARRVGRLACSYFFYSEPGPSSAYVPLRLLRLCAIYFSFSQDS